MAPFSAANTARMPSQPRWADEHPLALQARVDPAIRLAAAPSLTGWGLAAGWVPIVNRLHTGLVELLGEHHVVRAGNKMSALRYAIDAPRQPGEGPGSRAEVNALLLTAREESLRTCDLCGEKVDGRVSRVPCGARSTSPHANISFPARGRGLRAGWERGNDNDAEGMRGVRAGITRVRPPAGQLVALCRSDQAEDLTLEVRHGTARHSSSLVTSLTHPSPARVAPTPRR